MSKTIEAYLRDLTAYDVTDGAIENILIQVGVEVGADVTTLTARQKDLCTAYLYLWCATTPSVVSATKDTDGGWAHEEGGKQTSAYDKRLMRQMAQDILGRYGLTAGQSSINISSLGMKVFRGKRF